MLMFLGGFAAGIGLCGSIFLMAAFHAFGAPHPKR